MEFARRDEVFNTNKITTKNFLQEKYPLDLTFYLEPPDGRVPLDEMRKLALERVKLFRALEVASAKPAKGVPYKELVVEEMIKQKAKFFIPLVKGYSDAEMRRKDCLSHFILRISYCRSEEYKKWFVARECELFRLKYYNIERKDDITLFMKKNGLSYPLISEKEKLSLASELRNSTLRHVNLDTLSIYKVKFTEVLDLVRKRRVFLKGGYAYVPQTDLYSVLVSAFKKHLMEDLDEFTKHLPSIESDERVCAIVSGLHSNYAGKTYSATSAKQGVSKDSLDALSIQSFPLCMRAMHETFKSTHHLKHQARLQYGLFLKGIGMSLEESLQFWREGFTMKPDIDSEVFEKRYAYSIRHNYGTEGKRANYTPHNCMKIINSSVGPGENHGCPFKHYDNSSLKKLLYKCNISPIDVNNIADYAKGGHYQLACAKYYEVTHNAININGITHPNQYFEDSQKQLKNSQENIQIEIKKPEKPVAKNTSVEPKWDDDFDMSNISNIMEIVEGKVNS